jgi:hypothetical protein
MKKIDARRRINVRIHPIAKARMIAVCENRTRDTGVVYTLSMLLNDYGWSLPPVSPQVEQELRLRLPVMQSAPL